MNWIENLQINDKTFLAQIKYTWAITVTDNNYNMNTIIININIYI